MLLLPLLFRDSELQTIPEAPGDGLDQDTDYDVDHESPLLISAPAQSDTVVSPRIIETPNMSEASSSLPPLAPDIPRLVFVEHPLGPERDYS